MDSGYQPLDKEDEERFQKHSQGIDKAVREAFPSIPTDFKLKAVTIQKRRGCGIFYDYKIALPDGQFAKVSFHMGGYPVQRPPGEKEPEQHYTVDPELSSSERE